jgi:N-acetyl-anhydromuramyl-L-alanine amidase AmpD
VIWIPARNFTPAKRIAIDLIVIHSTESRRAPGAARAVAGWFAGLDAPRASAHYIVDDRDVVACVRERDVAWGAPGANARGVQVELVGQARDNTSTWHAGPMLARAAGLVAAVAERWGIPLERPGVLALRGGARGIIGHADASAAWHRSDHWDPGPSFPWVEFLGLVDERSTEDRR